MGNLGTPLLALMVVAVAKTGPFTLSIRIKPQEPLALSMRTMPEETLGLVDSEAGM
jgi:hypothetical protein